MPNQSFGLYLSEQCEKRYREELNMPIPTEAIAELVAYNWADEARDYEDSPPDELGKGYHIFERLQEIQDWLDTNPPAQARVTTLVIRNPDYENAYVGETEGDVTVETIDMDLGSNFNGPKDFDADSDWGREWIKDVRESVAHLDPEGPIRKAVEEQITFMTEEN